MPALLLDRPAAGATTCIIVGGIQKTPLPDVSRYRSFFWIADSASVRTPPRFASSAQWQVFAVDRSTTADFSSALESFIRLNPRQLPSVLITDELSPATADRYHEIIGAIHNELESAQRARLTRQKDGFIWQRHVLLNAPSYLRQRLPASWAGALRDLPAFVCGAGPSLDVSIGKLAEAAAHAVIFSADSALRALARHGVTADFAVSIDAAKVPEKCLPPDVPPRRIVLASVSPPDWPHVLPANQTYFVSGNQLTDDWLATLGATRTAITVTESCGSTALELAYHLGCHPIYLFGMDLAVDSSNPARRHQQHADPSLYLASNYDPSAQLPRVPGNYAETVPCFALGDWRELDARLAARTDGQVFNVNDRGARLRGTTLVHPNQFRLPETKTEKNARLALLPNDHLDHRQAQAALDRLRVVGQRCAAAIPSLRQALGNKGPAGLAEAFRSIVLDPDCGRALGAFSLKLMPHLVPPIEGERNLWEGLLSEFEQLAALASEAR